jgi:Methyl-accepting chemotaxis protein (MCP) signalling domain
MPERIVKLTSEVAQVVNARVKDIQNVTRRTKIIAINAMVEAARIGSAGRGFSVVAQEVGEISEQINLIADDLQDKLTSRVKELDMHGRNLIGSVRGEHLMDLSAGMIDIIDRNLYERTCDVRWWATDADIIAAAQLPDSNTCGRASQRLSIILDSYTVYLDLWILSPSGQVLANGRSHKYPTALQHNSAGETWFQKALLTRSRSEFTAGEVGPHPVFSQNVLTYATAIRENGDEHGRPLGVLAVVFDWQKQSQIVLDGLRIKPEEKAQTRCLLLDAKHRLIAATPAQGVLSETFPLQMQSNAQGTYTDSQGHIVGYAQSKGYETYAGLGWYGVLVQHIASAAQPPSSISLTKK